MTETTTAAPKKAAKKAAEKKTIQIVFTTEEDLALYNRLEEAAKAERRTISIYALLQLLKSA